MKKICRIGCVGLLSDIPLYVAHAKGLFLEKGIKVALSTELGWASIEARLASEKLMAANIPAIMPLLLAAGLGKGHSPLRALAATAFQSEAVVLSSRAHALLSAPARPTAPVRIGVESPYSFSPYFLHAWLRRTHPSWADRIAVVPVAVSQAIDLLRDGHVQGFCGPEPVCRVATVEGLGMTLTRSGEIFPGHLQSVLAAHERVVSADEGLGQALAAALNDARHYCARPENHPEILRLFLEQRSAIVTSSSVAATALGGELELARLVRFEGRTGPFETDSLGSADPLLVACLASAGLHLPEAELRQAGKRIFGSLRPSLTAQT